VGSGKAKMSSTVNAGDSRVNVLIRIVGIVFLVLGLAMVYETYAEAAADSLQPPLVPVLYLCAAMLTFAGFAAIVAKYRPSSTPKA
jgi:hypothetical protein